MVQAAGPTCAARIGDAGIANASSGSTKCMQAKQRHTCCPAAAAPDIPTHTDTIKQGSDAGAGREGRTGTSGYEGAVFSSDDPDYKQQQHNGRWWSKHKV